MIVVKVEMWPGGSETRRWELGRTYIWNDGKSRDPHRGDYGVAVARKNAIEAPYPEIVTGRKSARTGVVRDYPRLSYNVWRLIIRALKSAFPEEA